MISVFTYTYSCTGEWQSGQLSLTLASWYDARCLHTLQVQRFDMLVRGLPVAVQAGNRVSQLGQTQLLKNIKK